MPLPASLTPRWLAPAWLVLRLGSWALPGALGWALPVPAQAQSPADLQIAAQDVASAKALARRTLEDPASVSLDWQQAQEYLLAKRSASSVDYRNVLAEIGIRPGRDNGELRAWLPELVELAPSRISEPLQPVFADLLVTAATLSWVTDQIRHHPDRRREGLHTILSLANHHRGIFRTGVDDAMQRSSLWAVPTLLLLQSGRYGLELPSSNLAQLPVWLDRVHAQALREHAPSRLRNPQIMHDFLLALAANEDPNLAQHIVPALSDPDATVRQVARRIARWIADPSDEANRSSLTQAWTRLGADLAQIGVPPPQTQIALAQALGLDPGQPLKPQLERSLAALDEARKQSWAQQVQAALAAEDFDRLSAYFAVAPQGLIDVVHVKAAVKGMDEAAGLLLSRGEHQRAAELWARVHNIATSYKLEDHALYATKRDNALLAVPDLSPHARKTLHRSLRPDARGLQTAALANLPGWKGRAAGLFFVLLIPGILRWVRRRL